MRGIIDGLAGGRISCFCRRLDTAKQPIGRIEAKEHFPSMKNLFFGIPPDSHSFYLGVVTSHSLDKVQHRWDEIVGYFTDPTLTAAIIVPTLETFFKDSVMYAVTASSSARSSS